MTANTSRRVLPPVLLLTVLFLAALLLAPQPARAEEPIPADWLTPAERSGFRSTPSLGETVEFLERLAARSPAIHLTTFGVSAQGRPMPLVVVSREGAFTPAAAAQLARRDGKPVVLIQNGIHAGEIDGKDACLMILRDLALGRLPELLDAATLVIVPVYNVDGHERVSPYNRANQDGPVEGMGFRTTSDGLDLNRDHLKAVSPEARAVLRLFADWRPHLHVDDHVTDGSDHGWVLTWSWAEAPQLHPAVSAWVERHLPRALSATEAAGHPAGPYISLLDDEDPAQGFSSWAGEPRYATGYYPLRHVPSVLVEMHAYKPYEARVRANRRFLIELLREIGRDDAGAKLVAAVERAGRETAALGRADAEPSQVTLVWRPGMEPDGAPDRMLVPFKEWRLEESVALGVPILRYGDELRPTEVPWLHRPQAVETVRRPRGYLVLPGWPAVEERLAVHALEVQRLTAPTELRVEEIRVHGVEFASAPYQGAHRVEEMDVERRPVTRTVPEGSLWVPADQPDFEVAVQLFEPEAPDSLFAWGLLSTVVERKEYIASRVLERLVREMLRDEAVRAEWQAALEADPELAGDPRARWLWWYRRTPYWDDTVGLLPVLRVMERPDGLPLAEWAP